MSVTTKDDIPRPDYFSWLRHDILAHVPSNARCVLSVGCGAGVTEAELLKRGIAVTGIELDAGAAEVARRRGVQVIEGDVLAARPLLVGRKFDCIIYADVLEHLIDPVGLMREHLRLLTDDGTVIVSVPNFRHYHVLWQLFARGHIRYVDSGILDRTHVRLTTRRMAEGWFQRLGLGIKAVEYKMWQRRERIVAACSMGMAREFVARQVIVVGKGR